MRYLIYFFISIFCVFSLFGERADYYQSISNVLNEPYRYWHLKVDQDNLIKKASTVQRVFYRIASIFSNSHIKSLQNALEYSISEIQKYSIDDLSDKDKIVLEKICSIITHPDKKFWFEYIDLPVNWCNFTKWDYSYFPVAEDCVLMTPYKKDNLFFNDESEEITRMSISEIVLFLKSIFVSSHKIDLNTLYKPDPVIPRSDNLNVQWLGHSSFLIQVDGINIMVDPVTEAFHPLLGGLVKCFKRYIKPGVDLADLPKIDVVMISHNHLDHLEDKALFYLKRYQPEIYVPMGLKKYFDDKGFENVHEFTWWDKIQAESMDKKVNFYCVPASHNSMARGNVSRQESLWCGWVIEAEKKHVYFAGDTAFNAAMFRQIKEQFHPIDVALIPVAPDKMWERHIDHLDALRALNILDGKVMIPMHWGAYRTGEEKIEDPYFLMLKEKEKNPNFNGRIKILKVGQNYTEALH